MNQALPELNRSVRAEMARAGLSQLALAPRLGMSQPTLSRRLAGGSDWTIGELLRLAATLDVPLSTFLPGIEKASA